MGIFTKNILHTFSLQIIGFPLGVLISVIITRTLGPEGKGIFALAMLIFSLLSMFAGFGLNQATAYYVANKKYTTREVFGSNIIIASLISILALGAGLILIFFFNDTLFPGVKRDYLFLALLLFPVAYFFELASQILLGLEKIQSYNNVKFLTSLIYFFLLAGIFLFSSLTVGLAIAANILSYVATGIVLFLLVKKEIGKLTLTLNKGYLKDAFSYGLKVYPASMFYLSRYQINVFLLNMFLNPAAVGFYVTALGVSEITQWFSKSTSTVLFPKVAGETNEKNLREFTPIICRNILFITFLGIVFLFIFAKWVIIILYSREFLPSIMPFQIILIGTVAVAGWIILNTDIFARGKPMINTYIFGSSVALNTILNIFLIPRFGIIGASWALTISYLIMFLITLIVYAKLSGNKMLDVILIKGSDICYYKNACDGLIRFALRKK